MSRKGLQLLSFFPRIFPYDQFSFMRYAQKELEGVLYISVHNMFIFIHLFCGFFHLLRCIQQLSLGSQVNISFSNQQRSDSSWSLLFNLQDSSTTPARVVDGCSPFVWVSLIKNASLFLFFFRGHILVLFSFSFFTFRLKFIS